MKRFIDIRVEDGSVWRIDMEWLGAKVARLLRTKKTPWQKRYGPDSYNYSEKEASDHCWLEIHEAYWEDILELLTWNDVKDHITVIKPASMKKLFEDWKNYDHQMLRWSVTSVKDVEDCAS
jgi:hypothetical protein